jgi:hypothetical protein
MGVRRCGPEVTPICTKQQHLESRPVPAGDAGDDLELNREEWAAVCPRERACADVVLIDAGTLRHAEPPVDTRACLAGRSGRLRRVPA